MLPIGLLMTEHRLIERLIDMLVKQSARIREDKLVDIEFVDNCIDFISTYADTCHHGKEEDILFRALRSKNLSDEHSKILDELISEHSFARGLTQELVSIRDKYFGSEGTAEKQIYSFEMYEILKQLTELYPKHIEKEDKEFFLLCMDYFTAEEKEKIMNQFLDFDRSLIHNKYRGMIESYE